MLISNPFANQLFLPTLQVAAGVLGGSLLVLLVVTKFDPRRLAGSVLFERWRVWAVIAPLYGLAVLGGEVTLLALLSAIIFQALREYSRLVQLPRPYAIVLLLLGLLPAPVAVLSLETFYALPPILLVVATLQPLFFRSQVPGAGSWDGMRHLAFAALGWGYIAWLLSHVVLVYKFLPEGPALLLAIGLSTALSDVGAFAAGKLFGRHKLAPALSPNKTWEGVAGSFLGAFVGVVLIALVVPGLISGLSLVIVLALSLVIAVGCIWGDLLESALKREFGAKDAGRWLPGFGGLLDRVDSLIIVVPLSLYFLRAVY